MKINGITKPLAITMWDSSWLRRRYDGGGFEDFGQALDELVARGYNAVRIDPFPHMIANAPDGTNAERFLDPPSVTHKVGFAAWGSPWTVYIHPRRDLLEFLRQCEARGVYVLLATWLKPTAERRNELLEGPEDMIRIWHETLTFLQENDRLRNIIGVDVFNEFPTGACHKWLNDQLHWLHGAPREGKTYNEAQKAFFLNYLSELLRGLKTRWPDIAFGASLDSLGWEEYASRMDFTDFDFLDVHIWAERAGTGFLKPKELYKRFTAFGEPETLYTYRTPGYYRPYTRTAGDIDFDRISDALHESWYQNRALCAQWLEENIAAVAEKAKHYGIPCGNTEGWGALYWLDHPLVSWDLIKDAGLLGAELGRKYGFAFNCQSNFCEPQFRGLWKDVAYHQKITNIIRSGNCR